MKRALFLALLLANLGVLAWYIWYVPPAVPPTPAPALTGQPLKLTSELTNTERKALATASAAANAAQQPAPAPVSAAAPVAAPGLTTNASAVGAESCATYGPFPGGDAIDKAEARLKTLGLTTSRHTVPGKAKLGYWVYLPPFGSKREADAAADLLKKRGVADIYVVPDEANRNAVSLGVFNQHDGATQRVKEIKKLGFHPILTERFRDEPHYWIDAHGQENSLPGADVFKDLGEEGTPVGRGTGVCAGAGG